MSDDNAVGVTNEDLAERLDRIAAILQLAHLDDIKRGRVTIRSDKVNAAILDTATKKTPAGKLTTAVSKKAKVSGRTVRDRTAELVALGALEKFGGGGTTEYKATGLV